MTKNQRQYIKNVRNALKAVKRRLQSNEGNRYIISSDLLPVDFDKYKKGARLTNKDILENVPSRITKKQLENVSTKSVLSRLKLFTDEGDVIGESVRQIKSRWKKNKKPELTKLYHFDSKDYAAIPTEYEMLYDSLYGTFTNISGLGPLLKLILDELTTKYGKEKVGVGLRKLDEDRFWRMVEQAEYYDDAIEDFRQQIIEDLPDEYFRIADKEALRYLADNNESI